MTDTTLAPTASDVVRAKLAEIRQATLDLLAVVDSLEVGLPEDSTLGLTEKAKLRLKGFSGQQVQWLDDYFQAEHRVTSFAGWSAQMSNGLTPALKRVDKAVAAVLRASYLGRADVHANILKVNASDSEQPRIQAAINAVHDLAGAKASGERASLDIKPPGKLHDVVTETWEAVHCGSCGNLMHREADGHYHCSICGTRL